MSLLFQAMVSDVENAVTSGDALRRRAMLRSVAALFVGQAARLNEDQVDAFDAVIARLARNIESEARAELAERLADITNAPRATVRDLAFDPTLAVASPVLERSTQLTEDDLVDVAEQRGQGHLMALTRRKTLSTRVTDVLVTRGDSDVARSVAGNDGALFSHHGHTVLINRAAEDDVLRSTLAKRSDVPPAYRKRLVELAQERVQRRLGDEFGSAADAVIGDAAARYRAPVRDDALLVAEVAVSTLARKTDLNELVVCNWLSGGRETEALVALARLAGVPSRVALTAYEADSSEPMLILVRAAKCGWRTLKLALTMAGRPPSTQEMQGFVEAFQALSVATAQRVLRFTATQDATPEATAAI
jgi:uncharacterized protein (DUF2336 family)